MEELLTFEKYSEKSIQTFMIVAHRNHIELSGIADKKANIVLAVSAIIISAVLTGAVKVFKIEFDRYLLWPTAIFLFFMVLTMILSILTTMPKMSKGIFDREAVMNHKVNLAFFGNFHKMEISEYLWAVRYMQKDHKEIYKMLTNDLYFLGTVLDKKFKLLQFTYTMLICGVCISTIAYLVAFYIHYQ